MKVVYYCFYAFLSFIPLSLYSYKEREVNIFNCTESPLTITYKKPDVGFSGAHILVKRKAIIPAGYGQYLSLYENKKGYSKIKIKEHRAGALAQLYIIAPDQNTIEWKNE